MKIFYRALVVGILGATSLRAGDTNTIQPLTLAEAQQFALQNHPRISAANYQVLAAQESVTAARSAYFPAASLYATAAGANSDNTRILAGGINNPSIYDRLAGGISVSQLITDFGRTANLQAGSEYQAQAEQQNAAAVREQVLLHVSITYFRALEAKAVLSVARETLQTRQLLLDQVTALATNKLKSELDVSFARVTLEEGRLLLQKAQNDVDAAMATLANALGRRDSRPLLLVEPPAVPFDTNDLTGLIQTALGARPELLSLRDQSSAARRFARSEKDARRPTITAMGVIGNSPSHDARLADNYAAADLNVSLPLFSGGLYLARERRADLKAQAEEAMVRNTEDDIIREVRLAWLDVNNTRELLATTEELVRNAGEAFDLAGSRYQAGLSSVIELSEAQLNLTSAQIAHANAHYELLVQQSNLCYQTGQLH